MKFHLDENIVEGTPEELVKYRDLLKEADSYTDSTESSADEVETASTEIQVGDRVKVLDSKHGAEGEATVTKVLENGYVELEGKNENGHYSTSWRNHVSNLEKIEDAPMGYTFWYLSGSTFNNDIVLKTTLGGHFEDSKGRTYTYQPVHDFIKPLDREDARKEFEEAKHSGMLLKYYSVGDMFIRDY